MTDRDELALPIPATVAALYLVPATFPHGRLAQLLRSAISSRVHEPVRSRSHGLGARRGGVVTPDRAS